MPRVKKTNPAELPSPIELPALPARTTLTAPSEVSAPAPRASKLAIVIAMLQAPDGATIADLCDATGWQSHSVRGALAGSLKRKGHSVTSTKPADGPRRYRIEVSA